MASNSYSNYINRKVSVNDGLNVPAMHQLYQYHLRQANPIKSFIIHYVCSLDIKILFQLYLNLYQVALREIFVI